MRRNLSLFLSLIMIFNLCCISTTAITSENNIKNYASLEKVITNKTDITVELDKEDISDVGIEKVLKAEGILGLSKKQYVQLLSKHYKNADFEEDQALMEYTGTTQEFTEKYITRNSKIIGIKSSDIVLNNN